MGLRDDTDDTLDIRFNLSSPKGCINAANKNVRRVMPKLNMDDYDKSTEVVNAVGVVNTGYVNIEIPKILQRKKKPKNTHKTKDED